jgi:hypothetical protein
MAVKIEDDDTMLLCAIQYLGSAHDCVAGVASPNYSDYVGIGWLFSSSNADATVPNGGSGGIALSHATAPHASFAAKLADSTCIQIDPGDTSQFANGSPYVGDCDGTENEQGETVLTRASNSDNWGRTPMWGVSNGTTINSGDELCALDNRTCVAVVDITADASVNRACAQGSYAVPNTNNFLAFCK